MNDTPTLVGTPYVGVIAINESLAKVSCPLCGFTIERHSSALAFAHAAELGERAFDALREATALDACGG